MKYPPHPLLRLRDLGVPPGADRLGGIEEARRLLYFFNARSALFHVFRQLGGARRSRVLMPAFHCVSMIEPALHAGKGVIYYRVDRRLRIDIEDVLARAGDDVCAFAFVNYFGFQAEVDELLPEMRRRGIVVIEDCSHSFLRLNPLGMSGGRGDFSVYSFGKLVPSGVGGGLHVRGARFEMPPLQRSAPRDAIVRTKRLLEQVLLSADEGSAVRRIYLALESARIRRHLTSATSPAGAAATTTMPSTGAQGFGALAFDPVHAQTRFPALPCYVLRAANLRQIAAQRRRNFWLYAEQLAGRDAPHSLFPQLEQDVCPWAYPVLVGDRSQHDFRLRSRGVPVWTFGDLLHPGLEQAAGARAARDARFLASHLLCLPVHQGLPPDIVARFAHTVAEAELPAATAECTSTATI